MTEAIRLWYNIFTMRRYVFGVAGFVVLLLLVIAIANRNNNQPQKVQTGTSTMKLTDYASHNSNVSQTTVGKLVGDEDRREVRITVSPTERRLEVLGGYDETVLSSVSYPNTQSAYATFLSSLANLGFTSKKDTTISDPKGVCPTGNRYVYDLSDGGNHVSNLWSNSCDKVGTFAGRGSTIRELFQRQIPNYFEQVHYVIL